MTPFQESCLENQQEDKHITRSGILSFFPRHLAASSSRIRSMMAWWQLVVPSQSAPFNAAEWNAKLHNSTMSDFIIHSQLSGKWSPESRTSSTYSSRRLQWSNDPGCYFCFCSCSLLAVPGRPRPSLCKCLCSLLLAPECSCLFLLTSACSSLLRLAPACSGLLQLASACSGLLRLAPACSGLLRLTPACLLEANPATKRLKSKRVVARGIDFSTAASTTFVRRVAEAIDSITYLVNGETTRRCYQLTTLNRTAYQMGPIASSLNYSLHIFTIPCQSLQSSEAE